MNKAQRKQKEKAERLEREAQFSQEEARRKRQGEAFEQLPECDAKQSLQAMMAERIFALWDNCLLDQGDAILEFLPDDFARKLLDEYFHDTDENAPHPPETATGQNEDNKPR